jgi:hypothetical protein
MKVTEALVEQRHCFELLIRKIDDLVAAINHSGESGCTTAFKGGNGKNE